jgi:hypothetical protein
MYIRLFAATDSSPAATFALGYTRALMALAPVRVVSLTGGYQGAWAPYARLLATPMEGRMVNCVCGPPSRWTWRMKIAAPERDATAKQVAECETAEIETITGRAGLHTAEALRNIMFFCDLPLDDYQTAELMKFECRITPVPAFRDVVDSSVLVPVPVLDHAAFRELVLGKGSA